MSRVIGIALTCLAAAAFGSLRPDDNSPDGIWISRSAVSNLPVVGPAWEHVLSASRQPCTSPQLNDQNNATNVCVLAKALICARTGDFRLREEVIDVLRRTVDAGRYQGRALALGRELAAYVINYFYNTSYRTTARARPGKTVGWTDWTHAR